jgi:hypothetical protein
LRTGYSRALEVDAVVVIVNTADPAVVPERLTGLVDPKLRVGGSDALVGLEVIAAVSVTLPVKPETGTGVTLTVEVFPVLAPGTRVTAVPLSVNPGAAVVTTYVAVPFAAP